MRYAFISVSFIDPLTGAFVRTLQRRLGSRSEPEAIIEANGMTMADVVKTTVLLAGRVNRYRETLDARH